MFPPASLAPFRFLNKSPVATGEVQLSSEMAAAGPLPCEEPDRAARGGYLQIL